MKKLFMLVGSVVAMLAVTAISALAAAGHSRGIPAPAPTPVSAASGQAYRIAHYRAAQDIRGKVIPEQQIIADARQAAAGPGVPAAAPTAAAKARLMTLGAFDRANQLTTDPLLSASKLVWVVTVHAKTPLLTRPGDPVRSASVYTVVYDAVSGAAIEKGVNVNYVK